MDIIACQDRANAARKTLSNTYHSSCAIYDSTLYERQREQSELLQALERAFDREEFVIYLQPKIRLSDGKLAGAEALIRWIHPDRGFISPAEFIPLCEQNGLICRLDLYVFERVCRLIKAWDQTSVPQIPISVNMSRRHFENQDFLAAYQQHLTQYGVCAQRIEIELTESIMFSDSEIFKASDIVDKLHQIGFQCSLDDFGSGYSALGLLQKLPVDIVKLDRQFFVDCLGNPRAEAVVESIVQLAHKLHMDAVAEGIELEGQVELLRRIGCDIVQGFYFSAPLPSSAFEERYFS